MSNASIREELTNQIVEAIESGKSLPWRRPWSLSPNAGRPTNVVSKRHYSGINPILLAIHQMKHGFNSKWYGTYRQWAQNESGMSVKKRPDNVEPGEWGARIVFYRPITKTKLDPITGDEKDDSFFLERTFTVFNSDQVLGAERFQVNEESNGPVTPDFGPAEQLIESSGAEIHFGGERAFYVPPTPAEHWPNHEDGDYIQMPHKSRFNPPGSYYETLFHELAHLYEVRVQWPSDEAGYAMNELVAEMTASFLATELDVPQGESMENHAAYLKSWLDAMKGDSSFIFKASRQASRVADLLLLQMNIDNANTEPAIVL